MKNSFFIIFDPSQLELENLTEVWTANAFNTTFSDYSE